MKKFKLINLFYAAAVMLVVGMTVVPLYADNRDYDYDFSFEYGNREKTTTVYKDTDYPITMICAGSSGLSGLSYDAMAYSTKGGSSEEYTLDAGRMAVFREVSGFKGGGVYIQGALNGWDADSFWGTWNPDNPHY